MPLKKHKRYSDTVKEVVKYCISSNKRWVSNKPLPLSSTAYQNAKNIVVLEYIRLDNLMAVIYCYLEKKSNKVLNFHMNNLPYFELSASLC